MPTLLKGVENSQLTRAFCPAGSLHFDPIQLAWMVKQMVG
jgi:hypothetical protein